MNYKEFIEKCKERVLEDDVYTEEHHIIPKCMGGTNDDSNLIKLSGQEHYEAHRILALENPDIAGLQTAWWNMCQCKGIKGERELIISADDYAEARRRHAQRMSELYAGKFNGASAAGWNKGIPMPEEQKEKMREKLKGQVRSESQRKHISESLKGKPKPWASERMSEWNKQHPTKTGGDHPGAKSVICLENGRTYSTVKEASEDLDVPSSLIVRVCKGKQKQTKGYTFKYSE